MNFKQIKLVATSLLLCQNLLFPITAFALDLSSDDIQSAQSQAESPAVQSGQSAQSQAESPAVQESASSEVKEGNETPKTTETTETTETTTASEEPEPSTEQTTEQTTPASEETPTVVQPPSVQGTPPLIGQSGTGTSAAPTLSQTPPVSVINASPVLRENASLFAALPNLDQYYSYLEQHGQTAYVDGILKNVLNKGGVTEVNLPAEVNAHKEVYFSVPTYTMVRQSEDNGWISYIASDKSGQPEYYYKRMYYGDDPTYSSKFQVTNLGSVNISSYLRADIKQEVKDHTIKFVLTVTRTQATTEAESTFSIKGDVTLGTTAVTELSNPYPKPIADVSYKNVNLGTFKVKNEQPSHVIKSNVTVEAQRAKDLSQETIKSWFSTLPSNADDYSYEINNGPSTWQPGTSGDIIVYTSLSGRRTKYNTHYEVVDTTPPSGQLKDSLVYDWGSAEPNLRDMLKGNPSDNWSWTNDIQTSIEYENGQQFSELSVGEHSFTITLTDESGNKTQLSGTLTIRSPFTIQSDVVVEAQRNKDLTTDTLKSWFTTLPENADDYDYQVTSGPETWAPEDTGQVTVSVKNKKTNTAQEFSANYTVEDTQAPTATIKNQGTFEARKTGNLTREEILNELVQNLQDSWSLPENIQVDLFDTGTGQPFVPNQAPTKDYIHAVDLVLTDEAGNKSITQITVRTVDTTPPDGKLKDSLEFEEGTAEPELHQLLNGDPSDNWSLPENIQLAIQFEDDKKFSELSLGEHPFTLTLTDESGNKKELTGSLRIFSKNEYIDVTIPAKMNFAQDKSSDGIVSPIYKIQNNSERALTVSVESMTNGDQTERLPEMTLGMRNTQQNQDVLLISNGQNLVNPVDLATLTKENNMYQFSFYGSAGPNIDLAALLVPIKPVYTMKLHFEVQ